MIHTHSRILSTVNAKSASFLGRRVGVVPMLDYLCRRLPVVGSGGRGRGRDWVKGVGH